MQVGKIHQLVQKIKYGNEKVDAKANGINTKNICVGTLKSALSYLFYICVVVQLYGCQYNVHMNTG